MLKRPFGGFNPLGNPRFDGIGGPKTVLGQLTTLAQLFHQGRKVAPDGRNFRHVRRQRNVAGAATIPPRGKVSRVVLVSGRAGLKVKLQADGLKSTFGPNGAEGSWGETRDHSRPAGQSTFPPSSRRGMIGRMKRRLPLFALWASLAY